MRLLLKLISGVILIHAVFTETLVGQAIPGYPVSYRVFNPFIFNPAIAGSKDFTSVDLLLNKYGSSNAEMVSGNLRLSKSIKEYNTSLPTTEFTNFGVGGAFFSEKSGDYTNTGLSGTFAYHKELDNNSVSFLSFGVTAKGIFTNFSGNPDNSIPPDKTFFPEIDLGLYYYSSSFYAGLSATNLLGNPNEPDSTGILITAVTRQLFLNTGYKFILNRSMNIVLEPFLVINSDFEFSGEIADMFKPGLKLYAGNFCTGTYFNDFDKISFLFQYKYRKAYLGTYIEVTYKEPFYKQPILAEIVFGINLSAIKAGQSRQNHW